MPKPGQRPIDGAGPYGGGALMGLLRCALFLIVFASACSSDPTPAQPFRIHLDTSAANARVLVSGLSSDEASALSAAPLDAAAWMRLLTIATDENAAVPMAGRYAVRETTIEFTPAFALDAGRQYFVRFSPGLLPSPRNEPPLRAVVGLAAKEQAPEVEVTAVHPSADEWPENLLRFYVHFSGPMARESGVGRVHLIDESGEEVADALLPASVDFWSPDQTRYTVFFDPGRVKRGIRPNLELGRALVAGRSYTIQIDQAWRDADGRPLVAPFRKSFRAGPAREKALTLSEWRIGSPRAGSRDPLTVTVPYPLDRALFQRTLGVAASGTLLDGSVEVVPGETEWRFVPAVPWTARPHELVVLSTLEDPSGNRINQAFEVAPSDPARDAAQPERFTLPVRIAPNASQ